MKNFEFLSKNTFEALPTAEREAYLAQFELWRTEFKKAYGAEHRVELPITSFNCDINDDGNMAIVINNNNEPLINHRAFTLKPGQMDNLARAFQLPDIETLAQLSVGALEPPVLVVTLRPVSIEDTYLKNGVETKYLCPNLRAEDMSIELGDEIGEKLAGIMQTVVTNKLLGANTRKRVNSRAKSEVLAAVSNNVIEENVEP